MYCIWCAYCCHALALRSWLAALAAERGLDRSHLDANAAYVAQRTQYRRHRDRGPTVQSTRNAGGKVNGSGMLNGGSCGVGSEERSQLGFPSAGRPPYPHPIEGHQHAPMIPRRALIHLTRLAKTPQRIRSQYGHRVRHNRTQTRFSSSSSAPWGATAQQAQPPSAIAPLASITNELDKLSPRFDVSADAIEIIRSPSEFYATLKVCSASFFFPVYFTSPNNIHNVLRVHLPQHLA